MTRKMVMAGFAWLVLAGGMAAVFAAGPVMAASNQEARKACEEKASKHEPPLNAVDREAFMANCLADAVTNGKNN